MVLLKLNPKNYFSINDKTFYLKEIRFHTPSEHSIHQKHCPMEIQFIHQSNSEISALSVLVKKEKDNALLDDIINSLPDTTEKYSNVISINPSGLLPADKGYYTYNGSLTTPPCTENVKWYIMKEYLNASSDQIDKLTTYMPDNNIRAKQKLNNREILNID